MSRKIRLRSLPSRSSTMYMSLRDVGHVTVASSTGWQIGCNTVRSWSGF